MSDPKPLLLVTCDTLPSPPLDGHNRKTYEVLCAIHGEFDIRVIGYARTTQEEAATRRHWDNTAITWTFLRRRETHRHLRSVLQRRSLPTVTRDFKAEYAWVRAQAGGRADARLLIDFLSGAPLLESVHGSGVILSGHDCMSYLFRQEASYARNWRQEWHTRIRSYFAENVERQYAHLAERVHVVSRQDAVEFSRLNPLINARVIPLAGSGASAVLKPYGGRTERVIWGNLRSELIRAGLIRLLAEAAKLGAGSFRGWRMIGGVEEQVAHASVPQLAKAGICYQARVDDMSALLANTNRLCLPDIGGTGQKNRTLDGLAHGCCVIGLPEIFRGVGSPTEPAGLVAPDYASLVGIATAEEGFDFAGVARRGEELFQREFSLKVLQRRWSELINECGYLRLTGTATTS